MDSSDLKRLTAFWKRHPETFLYRVSEKFGFLDAELRRYRKILHWPAISGNTSIERTGLCDGSGIPFTPQPIANRQSPNYYSSGIIAPTIVGRSSFFGIRLAPQNVIFQSPSTLVK